MNYKRIAVAIAITSVVNLSAPTINTFAEVTGRSDAPKSTSESQTEAQFESIAEVQTESVIEAETISTVEGQAEPTINTTIEGVNRLEAKSTDASVSVFNYFNNEAYTKAFKVDNSNIKSIKNNAGHWSDKVILNAIDGDLDTHFETNKGNNLEWNNEIEVEFVESVILDRIVYGARQSDLKGFAEEFEIYSSNTSEGDNFNLVATGNHPRVKGLVEAKFSPTEFKRIKFVYKKSNQNWATANEILFYKEDKLSKEIENLFVDKTYTKVKDEYSSLEKLNELKDNAMAHPFKDELMGDIDLAIKIIKENIDFSESILESYQDGDMKQHAKDLGMNRAGQNLQPTGFYALPGETVTLYVEGENATMPSVFFSQNEGKWNKWGNYIKLKPGKNVIVVPKVDISQYVNMPKPGGALYISNPYTPEQQGKAPVIRFEGVSKYPYFKEGDNKEEFLKELKEYKAILDADNESGANKVLDIVEIESDRMIIAGTTTGAYNVYVNQGLNLTETTDFWDSIMDEIFKFYGLDGSSENQDPKNLKEHIRLAQKHGLMYASTDHVGVQRGHMERILDPNLVKKSYWGLIHEIGHRLDVSSREWTEYTNNMVSMHISYFFDDVNKDKFPLEDSIYPKVVDSNRPQFEDSGFVEGLAMFWQLNLYDYSYWTKLNRLYREELPKIQNPQHKKDLMIEKSSQILNVDLTEHFERHGFVASTEVKKRIKATYKPLDKKLWYLNDHAYGYEGTGFTKDNTSSIKRINADGILYIETDLLKDDLLGHEIFRDGELIGFTAKNTFKDTNRKAGVDHKYEVIPYAKDLSVGGISKQYNAVSPLLEINDKNIQVNLYEEFDAKKYVKALDYKGEDISNKIEVNHNVDTSKRGTYNVKYFIEDSGIKVEKEREVKVVSSTDYASDVKWESAVSGWKAVSKDTAVNNRGKIKLIVNDEIKEFDKGLGAAISAEIVYNIEGKGYEYFTSYVGAEKSYTDHRTSVIFKVIADGKEVYCSDVIRSESESEFIQVPLEGVKELKLILEDADGIGNGDYAAWGDAKFTHNNQAVNLEIGDETTFVEHKKEFNLMEDIKAIDNEDGDLTSKVIIEENGFNVNKPGEYQVKYSVTDSDNNTASKTKTIVVYSKSDYASDIAWESAVSGWKNVNKDTAVNSNNKIKLNVNGEIKEFDKGIGAATNAEIVYNLEDKDYEYFTTYVGTDKNYNDNRTSIIFKILADGKEVYTSDLIKRDSEAEFSLISLEGVKELKLIANDADGRGIGDFSSWGDTKFYTTNSKPSLIVEESISTKVGEPIEDLVGKITATDSEDGDITSNVVVEAPENINFNKAGEHKVTYSVTDSDNNTVTKERYISVVDMRDSKAITDYDWSSAVQGYKVPQKDTNVNGGQLKLTGEDNSEVVYERGIGSHADSTIIYDLKDKNYEYFTSYVGVDRAMYGNSSSVSFEVYVDGVMKYDSGIMKSKDPQKFVEVSINGAKELKLVVKDGGDGKGFDHATWGDAKLHFVNSERADLTNLKNIIEKAEAIERNDYTEETLVNIDNLVNEAKEVLNLDFVNQSKCDELINSIEAAINNLEYLDKVVVIEDSKLEEEIRNALNIESRDLTIRDMRSLTTLECTSGYVTSLKGLEHAINLESLNIDYNEVTDISVIGSLKKLQNFSGEENFNMNILNETVLEDGKFIIDNIAVDSNGERLLPSKVVLSPNNNPIELDLNEVLVGNKIVIDGALVETAKSIEVIYESENYNYQLYNMILLGN